MSTRLSRPVLGFTLALSLLAGSGTAFGQSDENRLAARSIATEGAAAFKEGRFQDAADMFTKAEALMHAPPHLLYLARANAQLGHFVKAREAYLKIIKEQLPASAPQAFQDAQVAANQELPTIEPKIGRLTIKVVGADTAQNLALTLDGQPIPSVLVGIAQPVDPGDHTVEATATGMKAAPQQVTVHDAERLEATLTLAVDPNAAAPVVAGGPAPAAAPGGGVQPSTTAEGVGTSPPGGDTGTSQGSKGMRIGAYVGFGVGAVGLGLGTVFLLQSMSKKSDANNFCAAEATKFNLAGGSCPLVDRDHFDSLNSSAKAAGTLAIVGYGVGAVGIATGVTLLVLSGHKKAQTAGIHPWVGLNSVGAFGSF